MSAQGDLHGDPQGDRGVLIAVAPNGARRGRADHAPIPLTAGEIAAEAAACAQAGAALIHMHVRDDAGRHSLDAGRYAEAVAETRRRAGPEMIIQITTEAAGVYDRQAQMNVVREVLPEAASCALRELRPDASAEADYAAFLHFCREAGVSVQHILYDETDIALFADLIERGVVAEPDPFVLLVIGAYAQAATPPFRLARMLARLAAIGAYGDRGAPWAVCAFGRAETRTLTAAAAMGGHVRVGFENNLLALDGQPAASNAERVSEVRAALRAVGLRPLNPTAARTLLGMSAGAGT